MQITFKDLNIEISNDDFKGWYEFSQYANLHVVKENNKKKKYIKLILKDYDLFSSLLKKDKKQLKEIKNNIKSIYLDRYYNTKQTPFKLM